MCQILPTQKNYYLQELSPKPKQSTTLQFQSWLTIFGYNEYFTLIRCCNKLALYYCGHNFNTITFIETYCFYNYDVENRVIDTKHTKTYYRKYSTSKLYQTFKFHIKPVWARQLKKKTTNSKSLTQSKNHIFTIEPLEYFKVLPGRLVDIVIFK